MITEREGIMAFAHIVAFQDFTGSILAAREISDNPQLVGWSAVSQHNEMARRLTGLRP